MERAVMETINLRQKTKYCDLEIKCDGTTFYVHRVIVCEQSEVLAKECDGGAEGGPATAVEHAVFDANTLERMLHFMYRGDYAVPTSNEAVIPGNGGLNGHPQVGAAPKTVALHLRQKASGAVSFEQRNAKTLYSPVTAHVYVYAIARYYEVEHLKALALRRFKNSDAAASVHEFLGVAKAVYLSTVDPDDELRHDLLLRLINKHLDWLTDGRFVKALASDTELHAFNVAVTSAMTEKFLEKIAILRTDVETQHAANVQLHSGLDQATQGRAEANAQLAKLQEDLEKANEVQSRLEERLHTSESWGKENFEKADNNQKAVQERDELLEKETARADRISLLLVQKNKMIKEKDEEIKDKDEKIRTTDEKIVEKDLKIKEETDRANQNHQVCMQRDQTIKQKDKLINDETGRANKNYEACMAKDHLLKEVQVNEQAVREERARGNRAFRHFNQAQNLINNVDRCRDCGWALFPLLYKDENKTVYIRCRHCSVERYAEHVD